MAESIDPRDFEKIVLKFLLVKKDIQRKVLPFLKVDVFESFENKELVNIIIKFFSKYNKFPSYGELKVLIKNKEVYDNYLDIYKNVSIKEFEDEFILKEIEDFFKDKLLWIELTNTVEGLKDNNVEIKNSSADRIREVLSFNLDHSIGLNLLKDGNELYERLHQKDTIISTGLNTIDKTIKGGFHDKTLTIFMGETNIGKSLVKCAFASNCLLNGCNVLYITLEMSEEKVSERIVSNIFDVNINDIDCISKDKFLYRFEEIKKRINNNLIIKEYPTDSINSNRIRSLIKELEIKENFKPDIVFIDYLGIMLPNRVAKNSNTNTELKKISGELRGIAVDFSIPIVSSTQTNRGGMYSSEVDLTNIADSIGSATVADIIFGITQTDELLEAGMYNFVVLKNRYGNKKARVLISVDMSKMRLSDTDIEKSNKITKKGKSIVDDAVVDIFKKMKNNKREDRKKILNIDSKNILM